MRARQTDFFESSRDFAPRRHQHGGDQSVGRRKIQRPLDPKRPVQLVMKSASARGSLSLLSARNRNAVDQIVRRWAQHFGVKLHSFENMGNHVHILASFTHREDFQRFLKTVAAQIARHVTQARKGRPFGKRFWDALAFTRVIHGRRDFLGMKNYLFKNRIEKETGPLARKSVEQYEEATRSAKRRGIDIWEILRPPNDSL